MASRKDVGTDTDSLVNMDMPRYWNADDPNDDVIRITEHVGSYSNWADACQSGLLRLCSQNKKTLQHLAYVAMFFVYTTYFAYSIWNSVHLATPLIVITALVVVYQLQAVIGRVFGEQLDDKVFGPIGHFMDVHWNQIKMVVYPALVLSVLMYLTLSVVQSWWQLQGFLGMICFILVPALTSKHPHRIYWRPVLWGLALQFVFGALVLRWPPGYAAIRWLAQEVNNFIFYALEGAGAVFGDPNFILHPFFMIMDSMLMLKWFIHKLTDSEFHCFLVGAHCSIAGFAFGMFVLFGVSPQHLLTAAVMSAPAAVAIAKLNWPETETSCLQKEADIRLPPGDEVGLVHAASRGGWEAGKSVWSILIQTISFMGLYALLDTAVTWMGALVGINISFAILLGYAFTPLAYMMGVEWEDCSAVGTLIGLKVMANEFLAYIELGTLIRTHKISERSSTIATYAMCGFSSLGTMVMMLGVWTTTIPQRAHQVSALIPRLLMNANLACFLTACVAGILYDENVEHASREPGWLGNLIGYGMAALPSYRDLLRRIPAFDQLPDHSPLGNIA